jgi:hypothetical protein
MYLTIKHAVKRQKNEDDMQFQPGNKGGGRPAIPEELKIKLKDGFEEAIEFWFRTMRDENAQMQYRDKAAEKIAAYAYGKPKEIMEIEHTGEVVESHEETLRKIDELLAGRATSQTTPEG